MSATPVREAGLAGQTVVVIDGSAGTGATFDVDGGPQIT